MIVKIFPESILSRTIVPFGVKKLNRIESAQKIHASRG